MTRRRALLVSLIVLVVVSACAAISVAQPAIVAQRLFYLSIEPRWQSGKTVTIDPQGDCMLRASLSPAERVNLADYLARSVNGYQLSIWRSELDGVAQDALLLERLNVVLFGRTDALLDRAKQRMKKLQALDGIPNLEQRLVNCAA